MTLIDAMKERGFQVNDTMTEFCQSEAAAAFTRKAAFFGREVPGHSQDMKDPNGDSYERPLALSDYEKQMIDLAKASSNGKVIVVLNSDMTMEIEELKQDGGRIVCVRELCSWQEQRPLL